MYKVVLIDDEPLILVSLERRIDWAAHGFTVVGKARGGEEGLRQIHDLQPDLVFTDIRMPDVSGLDLLREARKMYPDMLFAVLSGYSEFEYARRAIEYGVLGFCLKPFDENELYALLDKASALLGKLEKRETEKATEPARSETMRGILLYLQEHYKDPELSTVEVARVFGFNPNYVSQLFKKSEKETLTSYLTNLRMQKACVLLESSGCQVRQAGEQVGYPDYLYFAKVFKKHMGVTPSEYRAGLRGKETPQKPSSAQEDTQST